MIVVWDEPKRLANLDKHGLDFAELEEGFDFVHALALPATPSRAGRMRIRLIGTFFDELVVAVIVSPLGAEALAVISLRAANRVERKLYGE
jgi:uncharacterized DUF497 family protein